VVIPLKDLGKVLQTIEKLPEVSRIILKMKDYQEAIGEIIRIVAYYSKHDLPFKFEPELIVQGKEYKQLSPEDCGMIALDVSRLLEGMKGCRELLTRRLQPNIHRKIGAILLTWRGVTFNSL
jgi:hypothetical protein